MTEEDNPSEQSSEYQSEEEQQCEEEEEEETLEEKHAKEEKRRARRAHLARLRQFKTTLKYTLATTRFNNKTWEDNCNFRTSKKVQPCDAVYGSASPMSKEIPLEARVYVLEMNNETNKIMGIGMVYNSPSYRAENIYEENNNYNRYLFKGNMRIDATEADMTREELEIVRLLEHFCFKGCNHLKRGQGITMFPLKILYQLQHDLDLTEFVHGMFERRRLSVTLAPVAPIAPVAVVHDVPLHDVPVSKKARCK